VFEAGPVALEERELVVGAEVSAPASHTARSPADRKISSSAGRVRIRRSRRNTTQPRRATIGIHSVSNAPGRMTGIDG
jgi:hypothetical protein